MVRHRDLAKRDEDGDLRTDGTLRDVLNTSSGYRIGPSEIAVLIALREIPVRHHLPVYLFFVASGFFPVLEKKHRVAFRPGRHLPDFTDRNFSTRLFDAGHAVSGIRPPDRPGLGRPQRMRVADDVIDLGLAEHLVDGDSERLAAPFEYRLATDSPALMMERRESSYRFFGCGPSSSSS